MCVCVRERVRVCGIEREREGIYFEEEERQVSCIIISIKSISESHHGHLTFAVSQVLSLYDNPLHLTKYFLFLLFTTFLNTAPSAMALASSSALADKTER